MKNVIFGLLVVATLASCSKAKVRTCTIKTPDGNTYVVISDKALTPSEMRAYEAELVGSNTPNNSPNGSAKVSCR